MPMAIMIAFHDSTCVQDVPNVVRISGSQIKTTTVQLYIGLFNIYINSILSLLIK